MRKIKIGLGILINFMKKYIKIIKIINNYKIKIIIMIKILYNLLLLLKQVDRLEKLLKLNLPAKLNIKINILNN